MGFRTFRERANSLGIYKPNQGKKGFKREKIKRVSLEDILSNKIPFGLP
jgi:hypothetical protein